MVWWHRRWLALSMHLSKPLNKLLRFRSTKLSVAQCGATESNTVYQAPTLATPIRLSGTSISGLEYYVIASYVDHEHRQHDGALGTQPRLS